MAQTPQELADALRIENEILAAEQKITSELLKQASKRQEVNSGLNGYLTALKKIKSINETVAYNLKLQKKLEDENTIASRTKLKVLERQTDELKKQGKILTEILKDANKNQMVMASAAAGTVKNFSKLPGFFQNSFGKLKGWGLFEMDKSIKTSALEMGLLSKNSSDYSQTIRNSALSTNRLGVGVAELAKLQASYSQELGRTVMLGDKGLNAMSEMSMATGLGAEGSAKMAADMENQGLSAERTRDLLQETMNSSSKMGLNGSKVIKNMLNGMKLLNKYNFKEGVKGLDKMAKTVTKLGVGMEFATGMADKLFDIEGAVEMSAQLQVMGGAWANLADPFKLAYMARNDMAGLTEQMGKAAEASVHFNKETGEFAISAYEMDKLRKIADATNSSYDELASAAKNARKFTEIGKQAPFTMSKEAKEFLASTAQFDKNGNATVEIDGKPKLLKSLGAAGASIIEKQRLESETLAERVSASQTFDDKMTNLINMVKTTMLPIVDGINKVLGPLVDKFMGKGFETKLIDLGKQIGSFVEGAAGIVKTVGEIALALGPKGMLALFLGGKALGFLMDKAIWFGNGLSLSQGFMAGNSGGGGLLGTGNAGLAGKAGGMAKGFGGAGAGLLAAGMSGYNEWSENKDKGMGSGENAGRTALRGGGAGAGAWGGAAGGAALGTLIFPGVGTIIGGVLGGIAGGMAGDYIGDKAGDVTMGVHDGVIHSDFSKKRGIIQGGNITPIDNKDDLIAYKPNGPIDNSTKNTTPNIMKVEFGEIHFKFDELKVSSPGSLWNCN